ncbi:MAG: glycoside hydrolase family 1 protein [Candidatus Spechtbacterales bacterium]|nr:glycoside hydrolase family 1 protein [Candidatus Spechtbacterales bacterium]
MSNYSNNEKQKKYKFPKDFFWGTSTSAHQVEGGNNNNDWWRAEQEGSIPHKSGAACDSYNRYEEDFNLAQEMNNNAHRFSIEWSRIEPKEGRFDEKEIEHYRKVIHAVKKRGLEPFITLHHFTNPVWFSDKGGWKNLKAPEYFARYVEYLINHLGDEARFWITINEPIILTTMSYLKGKWPPHNKCLCGLLAGVNMVRAHKKAYKAIKNYNNDLQIGVAKNNKFYEAYPGSFFSKIGKLIIDYLSNKWFLNRIDKHQDFVGLNYYSHNRVFVRASMPTSWLNYNENKITSDFGWEIYPEGIYRATMQAWNKYKKPIYILENGVADAKDNLRSNFIREHLQWLHKAIEEGADVRGYFHWSLLDNFEWAEGFTMKFGLVEVDFETLERKPRESFYAYKKISKNNGF